MTPNPLMLNSPTPNSPTPYPLTFEPIYRNYLWGGRGFAQHLGRTLADDGQPYAESWELVDHGADQSVVASGPAAGKTLGELARGETVWLLGTRRSVTPGPPGSAVLGDSPGVTSGTTAASAAGSTPEPTFPLLFKFLDAAKVLSVQVHPNDDQAARQTPPDLGKTEAWHVLHAEPGARIYAGLKDGVTEDRLRGAVAGGTVETLLHSFEAQVGDTVFIPAGTVHAIGAGLMIAEIQQASDTTFRLDDWNRVDQDGRPRPLHIEEAIAVIDFLRGPVDPVRAFDEVDETGVGRGATGQFITLVHCDKFVLRRARLDAGQSVRVGGDGRFHILTITAGQLDWPTIPGAETASTSRTTGQVALLPAALEATTFTAQSPTTVLEMHVV